MAGYSDNPLYKKLGTKEGFHIWVINKPDDYEMLIGDMMNKVQITEPGKENLDLVHFFTNTVAELEATLPVLKALSKKRNHLGIMVQKGL